MEKVPTPILAPTKATPAAETMPVLMASPSPVALSPLERVAAAGLIHGDASDVVEGVRALADALASPGRDAVRVRLLSKALSSERTNVLILQKLLAKHLARGDERGSRLVEKALNAANRRMIALLREHRLESFGEKRVVLAVAHAENITVEGGGR